MRHVVDQHLIPNRLLFCPDEIIPHPTHIYYSPYPRIVRYHLSYFVVLVMDVFACITHCLSPPIELFLLYYRSLIFVVLCGGGGGGGV